MEILLTDGPLEFIERFGELLLFARIDRVSADVVEKQRDLSAVLHWRDEQVGQLKSVTSLVLVAPLNERATTNGLSAFDRGRFDRAQYAISAKHTIF